MLSRMSLTCGIVVPHYSLVIRSMVPVSRSQWGRHRNHSRSSKVRSKTKRRWSARIASGHSSPSISADRIFLTSYDKTRKNWRCSQSIGKKGKIAWRQPVPATEIEKVHDVSSPPRQRPWWRVIGFTPTSGPPARSSRSQWQADVECSHADCESFVTGAVHPRRWRAMYSSCPGTTKETKTYRHR